jgi:hypothetical protein
MTRIIHCKELAHGFPTAACDRATQPMGGAIPFRCTRRDEVERLSLFLAGWLVLNLAIAFLLLTRRARPRLRRALYRCVFGESDKGIR